jgi:phage shock protein PspC (stress-responsive transcriptional regulator)
MGRLLRSSNKAIAGVCAGIAEYFGWDVRMLRLIWLVMAILGAGCPVLFYLVLWMVMPEKSMGESYAERMQKRLGKK